MRRLERHHDRVVVELAPAGDESRQTHAGIIGVGAGGVVVERVLRIALAIEAEQHIVGIEIATGRETLDAVKAHASPQVERVCEAVVGDLPGFGKARAHPCGARFEFDDAVVERRGGRIAGP
jgi:hypothetical protein